jgi:segregation and condensation protein B
LSENQHPGAGAAFWAARGVRIEPEPDDDGFSEDAFDDDGLDDAAFSDDGFAARTSAVEALDAELETSAGSDTWHDPAPDPGSAYEIPAQAEAPGDDLVDEADPPEADEPAPQIPAQGPGWPHTDWPAGQWSADPAEETGSEPEADDGFAASIPAQTTLDEVEPQDDSSVVDGLSALNYSLSESRRARVEAERLQAEPAWQLTDGELSAALPPLETCLEAILMVVDEPVAVVVLAQVVERPTSEVEAALRTLSGQYTAERRGFDLREVGTGEADRTGWRIYTRSECAPVVERFVRDGQQARLTQAALETLAVVAYRQPVSRSKVSAIRGVNCDGVMRTLLARGLVEECGTEYETGALLYRTTGYFLERMGLKGLDELPDLAPLLPSAADMEDES